MRFHIGAGTEQHERNHASSLVGSVTSTRRNTVLISFAGGTSSPFAVDGPLETPRLPRVPYVASATRGIGEPTPIRR